MDDNYGNTDAEEQADEVPGDALKHFTPVDVTAESQNFQRLVPGAIRRPESPA